MIRRGSGRWLASLSGSWCLAGSSFLPDSCWSSASKGLDRQRQKVHQLWFMRFIHSGLLDRSASDAFPVAFNHEVCGFCPEGLQTPVV